MASERRERVIVTDDEDFHRKQKVVEHSPSTQRILVSRISQLIWFLVLSLDILLLFRFVMKLIDANAGNAIVNFIYTVTDFFVFPYQSIVPSPVLENGIIIDITVLFAIVMYTIAGWAIVTLFRILFSDARGTRNVTTYERQS